MPALETGECFQLRLVEAKTTRGPEQGLLQLASPPPLYYIGSGADGRISKGSVPHNHNMPVDSSQHMVSMLDTRKVRSNSNEENS
jgi:hypothetical protein